MKLKVKFSFMPIVAPSWDYVIRVVEPIETKLFFISISLSKGLELKEKFQIETPAFGDYKGYLEEKKRLLIVYLPEWWNVMRSGNEANSETAEEADEVELIECDILQGG